MTGCESEGGWGGSWGVGGGCLRLGGLSLGSRRTWSGLLLSATLRERSIGLPVSFGYATSVG